MGQYYLEHQKLQTDESVKAIDEMHHADLGKGKLSRKKAWFMVESGQFVLSKMNFPVEGY